jgi:hypothetical protein
VKEGLGGLPLSAEEGARAAVPVLVYPELSTVSGQTEGYKTHPVAGIAPPPPPVGNLTFTARPLPSSFYRAVVETHVASQEVDYLPQVPPCPPVPPCTAAPCRHAVSNTRRLLCCAAAPPDAPPDACPPRPVRTIHTHIHPQVPNLPTARTVGRVKPRSAAVDVLGNIVEL